MVADGRLFGCCLVAVWLRIGRLVAASRLLGGSARAVRDVPGWTFHLSLDVASVLFGCCLAIVWFLYGLLSGWCLVVVRGEESMMVIWLDVFFFFL